MIKSIEKLKVRIDQNLNRAEKSEALSEDVVKIETRITSLKQLCQSVTKKLSEFTASSSKLGNDGAAVEKRIRKTPEFALGQTFQENGRAYAKHGVNEEPGGLSSFLMDSGHLLNDLAASQVQYEIGVEKLVLQNLSGIVDDHVPNLAKERKTLTSLLLDYDAAKSRLVNYRQKEGSASAHGGTVESDLREDRLSSELADIETKLNFSRDSVELHMLQFLSKESEVGDTLLKYLQLRRDFHEATARQISDQIEHFQKLLSASTVASPIYGCGLDEHLRKQGHGVCIALPLRTCVCRLLQLDAIREEGIFRVASSSLKIRRLAALFDAGETNDVVLKEITDPHVFSGALKLYLRELPTPLLGSNYDSWMSSVCQGNEERKKEAIDGMLSNLPQNNRHNLHYLLKFLQLVASHCSINKMTSANLSIVLAPNLLWDSSSDGESQRDLNDTNVVNDIVETLINHVDYFFRGFGPGSIDYFKEVTLEKPKHMQRTKSSNSSHEESSGESGQRTPIPKPRQSRITKGPPPPLAPRPADRASLQNSSTHL